MVRYSVLQGNEQLFASQYQLVLPTEEELRNALDRDRRALRKGPSGAATPRNKSRYSMIAHLKNPCKIDALFFQQRSSQ